MLCANCEAVIHSETKLCSSCGQSILLQLQKNEMSSQDKIINIIIRITLLLVIAIPTYIGISGYRVMLIRSEVVNAILDFNEKAETAITVGYPDKGEMPADFDMNIKTARVKSVIWTRKTTNSGFITVKLSESSTLGSAASQTIILKAQGNPATYHVIFSCEKSTINNKYQPSALHDCAK